MLVGAQCYVRALVIVDLISRWWHWVFKDLMGDSVLLMWLFGWEIFLTPIVVVTVWSYAIGVTVWNALFRR